MSRLDEIGEKLKAIGETVDIRVWAHDPKTPAQQTVGYFALGYQPGMAWAITSCGNVCANWEDGNYSEDHTHPDCCSNRTKFVNVPTINGSYPVAIVNTPDFNSNINLF